jgi:hypothetical protein
VTFNGRELNPANMKEEEQEAIIPLAVVHAAAVPEIAIQWVIQNCSSNQELATLSNVCRSWRVTTVNEIQSVTGTTATAAASEDGAHSEQDDSSFSNMTDQKQAGASVLLRQGDGEAQRGAAVVLACSTTTTTPLPLASLLLPSMGRERIRRLYSSTLNNIATVQATQARNAGLFSNSSTSSSRARPPTPDGVVPQDAANPQKQFSLSSSSSHPGSGVVSRLVSQQPLLPQKNSSSTLKPKSSEDETYCLAWFHPDGIELLTSSALIKSSNSSNRQRNIQSNDVNDCSGFGAGYMEPSSAPIFMDQPTALEWRSYVKACDILQPFGYALSFIEVRFIDCRGISVYSYTIHFCFFLHLNPLFVPLLLLFDAFQLVLFFVCYYLVLPSLLMPS